MKGTDSAGFMKTHDKNQIERKKIQYFKVTKIQIAL